MKHESNLYKNSLLPARLLVMSGVAMLSDNYLSTDNYVGEFFGRNA